MFLFYRMQDDEVSRRLLLDSECPTPQPSPQPDPCFTLTHPLSTMAFTSGMRNTRTPSSSLTHSHPSVFIFIHLFLRCILQNSTFFLSIYSYFTNIHVLYSFCFIAFHHKCNVISICYDEWQIFSKDVINVYKWHPFFLFCCRQRCMLCSLKLKSFSCYEKLVIPFDTYKLIKLISFLYIKKF